MMRNVPTTYQGETVEEFTERLKNGLDKKTKYHNYFATLRPADRPVTTKVKGEKRLTEKERFAILMELL